MVLEVLTAETHRVLTISTDQPHILVNKLHQVYRLNSRADGGVEMEH